MRSGTEDRGRQEREGWERGDRGRKATEGGWQRIQLLIFLFSECVH